MQSGDINMTLTLNQLGLSVAIAGLTVSLTPIANAATLKADYNFNGDFASSVSGSPDLVKIHHDNYSRYEHSYLTDNLYQRLLQPNDYFGTKTINQQETSVFNYDYGTGFQLSTEGLIDNSEYSVAMRFQFDLPNSWPSWHRIIDFKNLSSDYGLYNVGSGSNLSVYGAAGSSGFVDANADGWYDLVMTRTNNNNVNIFIDGQSQLSFLDSSKRTEISSDNVLNFFLDNYLEYTAGSVDRIMIFDGALDASEVASLDLSKNVQQSKSQSVPEPATHLGLGGLAAVSLLRKKRKSSK